MYIGVTPHRGKRSGNSPALCQMHKAISNPDSASRAWTGSPTRTATLSRPGTCKKPSASSSSASARSAGAHEHRRALWKCRAGENEENQTHVSLLSHRPWKSLLRFPHFHRAGYGSLFSSENDKKKPQKGAPHCDRLISSLQAHPWIRKCSLRPAVLRLGTGHAILAT